MKTFALRLALFSLILLSLQVIISALYPPIIPEEIEQLEQYLQDDVDIIYFGDSTVFLPEGEVTTGDILQEMLPTHTVGEISHPAYNLDLYLYYVEYIVGSDHRPQTVIIPINMRSFSPEWDLRPSYQFETEKTILSYGRFLSTVIYKPLDTLGGLEPEISRETFLNTPVYNGQTAVGTVAEYEALLGNTSEPQNGVEFAYHDNLPSEDDVEALEGLLVYYYMSDLSPNHRKLRSMLQIIDLLQANDIRPIFYLTPINYELGQRYIGQPFQERLADNTGLVEGILRAKGLEPLNLVFGLAAYTFTDTEHLREIGKAYVAEQLARRIEPETLLTAADSHDDPVQKPPVSLTEPSPTATRIRGTETPPPTDAVASPTLTTRPTQARVSPTPTFDKRMTTQSSLPITMTLTTVPTIPSPTPTALATATELPPTPIPTMAQPTTTAVPTPAEPAPVGPNEGVRQVVSVESLGQFQPIGRYQVRKYGLRFQSLDRNNQIVELQAEIFVPVTAESTAFPVMVYGAGTTGIGNGCAPLNERLRGRNWGAYNAHMLEYAAQGTIGILPNWLGFSDPNQTHPYFIAELQARVMLDAARAVYSFFGDEAAAELQAEPMSAVFFGGYSSGGHAAFAAKDYAASYAPDVPVKGIIGHGATTDIEVLLREDPVFSPYIVYAYRQFYGSEVITPDRVFLSGWLPTFDLDVTTKCVDELFLHYAFSARQMYQAQFNNALYNGQLESVFPAFKRVIDENSSGLSPDGADIPVLILQGTADLVVTPPSQARFGAALCSLGNSVTYMLYPAVPHAAIRRESFRDTLNWMADIANGGLPENNCDTLAGQ